MIVVALIALAVVILAPWALSVLRDVNNGRSPFRDKHPYFWG